MPPSGINPVAILGAREYVFSENIGVLGDVAPTILALMGLSQPEDMDGSSLLVKS